MYHIEAILCFEKSQAECSIISLCQFFSYTEAVVNMARTTYTVREDVGMFEICMTVSSTTGRYTSCPVAFDFSVVLLTLDDSAGNSTTPCT